MLKYSTWIAFCALGAATVLAAQDDYLSEEELFGYDNHTTVKVSDPLESINRLTFKFNDFLYLEVFDPVAKGYQWVAPDPVEVGIRNFFRNLRYPVRLSGNLLQGRWHGAWVETGRFAVNTTVGIGGLFTPADEFESLQSISPEDIGQALGAWGIGEGPFLVIPVFGPSNVRGVFGMFGNRAVHPTQEPFSLIDDWDWEWETALGVTETISSMPALLNAYKEMKGMAIDPYSSLKSGYAQLLRAAVAE